MVNLLDSSVGTSLMTDIGKTDEGLSQKIQDLMFVFEDLLEIDDRGMQELLRQVPADKLLIALKGADDTFKTKVFKNMSQRAAEMLKGDLEAKGPVRLADVEAAQKEILLAARKLSDDGTIQLGGKGEQYV
jgi:flagellar motor switch protein FliG